MGNDESKRFRQRFLEIPYGHPQKGRQKSLLPAVRRKETVQVEPEPVEVGDTGAISVVAPVVVEEPDDVIDLQFVPRENLFIQAIAHVSVQVIRELGYELEDVIDEI